MKRIEVKLSLPVVAPLLDLIKATVGDLDGRLAAPQHLQDLDEELRTGVAGAICWTARMTTAAGFWRCSTASSLRAARWAFDEDNAESVLRACAAIRLRLRDARAAETSRRRDRERQRGCHPARRRAAKGLHVLCLPGHAAGADHPASRLGDPGRMRSAAMQCVCRASAPTPSVGEPSGKMTYAEEWRRRTVPSTSRGVTPRSGTDTCRPRPPSPRAHNASFRPSFSAGHWPVLIRHKSIASRRAAATARRLRARCPVAARSFCSGGDCGCHRSSRQTASTSGWRTRGLPCLLTPPCWRFAPVESFARTQPGVAGHLPAVLEPMPGQDLHLEQAGGQRADPLGHVLAGPHTAPPGRSNARVRSPSVRPGAASRPPARATTPAAPGGVPPRPSAGHHWGGAWKPWASIRPWPRTTQRARSFSSAPRCRPIARRCSCSGVGTRTTLNAAVLPRTSRSSRSHSSRASRLSVFTRWPGQSRGKPRRYSPDHPTVQRAPTPPRRQTAWE